MRKLLKILFVVIAFLLCAVVLTSLALRFFFPSAKLRHAVEQQIRMKLNREAQIGAIRLGLRGISITRFKLSEVPSLAEGGLFLAVDKMEVRWALMPLLSKRMEIKAVVLNKPSINIVRMADGKTLNINDLAGVSSKPTAVPGKPHPATAAPGEKAKDWTWKVDAIELKQGAVRFDDRSPARQTSTLTDIDLLIRDFDATQMKGRLEVKKLDNPVYRAENLSLEWTLQNIDSSLARLSGTMQLKQGPGLVQNLSNLANSSKGAKLALMPMVMLQNLDRLGFVKLGLPDFSRLEINDIKGAYSFQQGTMKIDTFQINSVQATIGADGTVQLASGQLAVNVSLHTPEPVLMGEMDLKMSISGTLSNPKTNLDHLKKKAFKATVNQLLQKPEVQKKIDDALKNIFR